MKFLIALPILLLGVYQIVRPKMAFKSRQCAPAPLVLDQQDTSFVSAPVIIPQQLIQDKINSAIRKEIIRDEDFDNPNKKNGTERPHEIVGQPLKRHSYCMERSGSDL